MIRVCAVTCDCYLSDPLVRRTAEAAVGSECEYHVICSQEEGELPYEVFHGVHIHRICIRDFNGKPVGRITSMSLWKTLLLWCVFTIRSAITVTRLHWNSRFDVVHCHNLPDFLVFAATAPKLAGAKVILHIQDVTPELMSVKATGIVRRLACALSKWQERLSTAFADHVITVGPPFEVPLLRRGVPRQKLSSILNSADPALFHSNGRTVAEVWVPAAERPLIFMYHGTCAHRNGVDIALRAFAKASTRASHIRLHLKVREDAIAGLRSLAQDLGVSERVTFWTPGTMESVVAFIEAGDIGVIPYRSDGFMDLILPTKSYEFALMRRPMIASDMAGVRSIFGPNSILYCEPSNIDHFADAMVELYRDPSKREALVQNATEDYRLVRWEIMAEQYRALLNSLAQPSSTGVSQARVGQEHIV